MQIENHGAIILKRIRIILANAGGAAISLGFVAIMPFIAHRTEEINFDFAIQYMETHQDPDGWAFLWFVAPVVIGLIWWWMVSPGSSMSTDTGEAKLATDVDIHKMGLGKKGISVGGLGQGDGVVLGKIGKKYLTMDNPLSVLGLAPPGTGKTKGLVIPSIFNISGSLFITDIKNELFMATSAYRGTLGKVVRFSPCEAVTAHWNPLDIEHISTDWNTVITKVTRLASIIYPMPDSEGTAVHFANAARTMFTAYALYLIDKHGEISIPEIRKFHLSLPDGHMFLKVLGLMFAGGALPVDAKGRPLPGVIEAVEEIGDGSIILSAIGETAHRVGSTISKEASSIVSTFANPLDIFMDEHIANAFSGDSDFSAATLKADEVVTVYQVVAENDVRRISMLSRVLLDTLMADLIALGADGESPRTTLILDEFLRWGKIPDLLESPAIQRGSNICSVLIAQSASQITKLYGRDMISIVNDTCEYRVIYRQNDFGTAKAISDQIGTHGVIRKTKSNSGGQLSISESIESVPLIRPEDLMGMGMGETLILSGGFMRRPIKCESAYMGDDKRQMEMEGVIRQDKTTQYVDEKKYSKEISNV